MKKTLLALIALLAFPTFARANEYKKSAREIRAIIASRDLERTVGGAALKSIEKIDCNTFLVLAGDCAVNVDVDVIGAPSPGGPVSTIVTIGEVNCLPGGFSVGNN